MTPLSCGNWKLKMAGLSRKMAHMLQLYNRRPLTAIVQGYALHLFNTDSKGIATAEVRWRNC